MVESKNARTLFGFSSRSFLLGLIGLLVISGPVLADDGKIDISELKMGLDTVWVLLGAFLVFFMQAGLVAVCAGSDLYHPIATLVVGAVAGALFVFLFVAETGKWRIDDVLGVWPLHGACGAWGGIAAGIFGLEALGGRGGVSFFSQLLVTAVIIVFSLLASTLVYGILKMTVGIRIDPHAEQIGADLAIHMIEAQPEDAL